MKFNSLSVLLVSALVAASTTAVFGAQKTFLLVGLTGSGKSTTGNCIYNRRGDMDSIAERPFATSDAACGCTRSFSFAGNDKLMVIDTVGFGDPQFEIDFVFNEFKFALNQVNNQIDAVMFIVKKGRFSNELVEFFEIIQEKVLKGQCKENSVLVITNCNKGWLEKPEQVGNRFIQRALNNTNRLAYEFFLKFDDEDADEEEDRLRNQEKRQKSINDLVGFLDSRQFKKIDLSYVQSVEFEANMKEEYLPALMNLFRKIVEAFDSIKDLIDPKLIKTIFG